MDEPTASLTAAETKNLFDLICQLRGRNVAVIYISHRLDEIFEIADEVTVLRDGYRVLHCPIGRDHERTARQGDGGGGSHNHPDR